MIPLRMFHCNISTHEHASNHPPSILLNNTKTKKKSALITTMLIKTCFPILKPKTDLHVPSCFSLTDQFSIRKETSWSQNVGQRILCMEGPSLKSLRFIIFPGNVCRHMCHQGILERIFWARL